MKANRWFWLYVLIFCLGGAIKTSGMLVLGLIAYVATGVKEGVWYAPEIVYQWLTPLEVLLIIPMIWLAKTAYQKLRKSD